MEAVFMFVVCLGLYLIPTFIAMQRKHTAAGVIFCINFFLGWTFIGWLVAVVWAASGRTEADDELRRLQIKALRDGGVK